MDENKISSEGENQNPKKDKSILQKLFEDSKLDPSNLITDPDAIEEILDDISELDEVVKGDIPKAEIKEVFKSNVFEATSLIYVKGNTSVEQNVSKRASSFYQDIKNEKLRKELVEDFTEMEWAYLKNDIIEFSRRAHKQLEAIANFCLFEKIGLSKLQTDFLNKKGVSKVGDTYKEIELGKIIMAEKSFEKMKADKSFALTDSDIPTNKRDILFCYYYLNTKQAGFDNPMVINWDYKIMNDLNYFRKKASHGWLRGIKPETVERLNAIVISPGPYYFDVFYLLRKYRFTDSVAKNLNS
jgi:hypothetical protein